MKLTSSVIVAISGAVVAVVMSTTTPVKADYTIVNGAIEKSLTGKPGNSINGKKIAIKRKKGNCLACHAMPIPDQQFHGEVGPDLSGVASRYSAGELRARIVNPKLINASTIMPAFLKSQGLHRSLDKFKGKTILSAQEIEDVISYLMTLKE